MIEEIVERARAGVTAMSRLAQRAMVSGERLLLRLETRGRERWSQVSSRRTPARAAQT